MVEMSYTGERVIPIAFQHDPRELQAHCGRYIWALEWCAHKEVLDCSCGAGYGTMILSWVADWCLGIDISPEAIAYARQNYLTERNHFQVGSAYELMKLDGNYDVIVSFETIEHLKDPALFVRQAYELLEPEGVFIVSAPENSHSVWHVKDYTKRELCDVVRANGDWTSLRYFCQGPRQEIVEDGEPIWDHPTHIWIYSKGGQRAVGNRDHVSTRRPIAAVPDGVVLSTGHGVRGVGGGRREPRQHLR